jgi:thymidylate synthase
MKEFLISDDTLPKVYHSALLCLKQNGIKVPCPDYNTEQIELSMTLHVEHPLQEPRISRCGIFGPRELQQYEMEMSDGILDFEIQPEKGKWSYTYHNRYEKYYQFVIDELVRNEYSRRAIISIRDNDQDILHDDPACFQSIQFFIRNNQLHCKVFFRSNDLLQAAFMNMWALIKLQEKVLLDINAKREKPITIGSYTHRANSMHVYAKSYKDLDNFCDRIITGENLVYNYEDEWADIMKDEIPGILKLVQDLKSKP